MSSQQDIYAASFETRPPMLNKENYAPWSTRLLCYAKSRPNGKLIYNSIMNGSYVRRMILEPGDLDREVTVNETFHEQTDDELTKKKLKQVEADDQAIQTILLGLPEVIFAAVDSCETAQEIWLHVQQMMKGFDIGIQIAWNQMGYNAVQNFGNQNLNRNGSVVAARAEGNAIGNNGDLDEIKEVNANCILMANLHILKPIPEPHQVQHNDNKVISAVSSVEQSRGIVEQNPTTVEETRALYDSLYNNLAIEVEKVNTVNRKLKETNAELTTELAKYKNQKSVLKLIKKNMTNLKGVIKSLFIKNNV
nr:hypothetical protein [Tanacetum cinerariifolium]